MQNLKKVQNCAQALQGILPQYFHPKIGLVLGTGLGNLTQALEHAQIIPYTDLPNFPQPTAPSHQGAFFAGLLAGVPVLVQQGRCHLYEGKTPDDVCMGVRVMGSCGIAGLVLTNAAGAVNPHFAVGSLMLIEDHINLTRQSPLAGPNEDAWGPRFPDMSDLYDRTLSDVLTEKALENGIRLEKGVYVCVPGPQMETRAETRAYRLMGGDAVGMSTALEAIAARHMGLRVIGLSCLSNKNLPDCMEKVDVEEVIRVAQQVGKNLERLLMASLPELATACAAYLRVAPQRLWACAVRSQTRAGTDAGQERPDAS